MRWRSAGQGGGHAAWQRPGGAALAAADRVWLLDRRARSPQRAFALQEVELATGRRLASVALPHDTEPVAMVDGGVLVRDLRAGLAVRDLASGRERQRLGTDLTFVDATARLVAYVDDRGDLRLRDLATRRDRVVRPTGMPNWFPMGRPVAGAGCCDQFGAFSADGRRLAVYVQLRRPAQPGLAVVDVGRAEARPVPGSQAATPFRLPAVSGLERRRLAVLLLGGAAASRGHRLATRQADGEPAGPAVGRHDRHRPRQPGGLAIVALPARKRTSGRPTDSLADTAPLNQMEKPT